MASKEKLTDVEKEIIAIELEKSRLNREKSMLVLNKSIFLYFSFMFIGVIGFINEYLTKSLLNLLIMMGLIVLIIGIVPYVRTMNAEQKALDKLSKWLKEKQGGKK